MWAFGVFLVGFACLALGVVVGYHFGSAARPEPEPATPPEPAPPVKANHPEFAAGVAVGYLAGLREQVPDPDVVPFPTSPLKLADLDADE